MLREMAEQLALDLVDKGLVTDQLVLTVAFDIENLTDPARRKLYRGPVVTDHYGRQIPKHGHGSENLGEHTSSGKQLLEAATALFERIAPQELLVRKLSLSANHVIPEAEERRMQQTMMSIKKKFGKNAILKGMSLEEGATARERNAQIGGHKA